MAIPTFVRSSVVIPFRIQLIVNAYLNKLAHKLNMKKGLSMPIETIVKWVLALLVLLVLVYLLFFMRDRSIIMILNTIHIPGV